MFGANSAENSSPGLSPKASHESSPYHQQAFRVRHQSRPSLELDDVEMNNVVTMVCFATALMENLARINRGKCGGLCFPLIILL